MKQRVDLIGRFRDFSMLYFDIDDEEITPTNIYEDEYLNKFGSVVMKMFNKQTEKESSIVAPMFLVVNDVAGPVDNSYSEKDKDKKAFSKEFLFQQCIKLVKLFWQKPENQEIVSVKIYVFIASDNHFIAVVACPSGYLFKEIVRLEIDNE